MKTIPSKILDQVDEALDMFGNTLFGGLFSLNQLDLPDSIMEDLIKQRGHVEQLKQKLFEFRFESDPKELEKNLKEIEESGKMVTDTMLKRFRKKA